MTDKAKKILLWILDIGLNLLIIFALVFVIQKWIIAPFDVSGSSMCNTLNFIDNECHTGYGEKIIINEAGYAFNDPQRGDIVVFKAPHENPDDEEKYFIKRVIGIPGDTVEIKSGSVYVKPQQSDKSIKIEEPYLSEKNSGNTQPYFSNFSVFEVPEGKYFLMGDNRQASTDSRSCFQSSISLDCKQNPEKVFIERKQIRGKAWVVWWPLSTLRLLDAYRYPELSDF